jgi:hypothetical protein
MALIYHYYYYYLRFFFRTYCDVAHWNKPRNLPYPTFQDRLHTRITSKFISHRPGRCYRAEAREFLLPPVPIWLSGWIRCLTTGDPGVIPLFLSLSLFFLFLFSFFYILFLSSCHWNFVILFKAMNTAVGCLMFYFNPTTCFDTFRWSSGYIILKTLSN